MCIRPKSARSAAIQSRRLSSNMAQVVRKNRRLLERMDSDIPDCDFVAVVLDQDRPRLLHAESGGPFVFRLRHERQELRAAQFERNALRAIDPMLHFVP